MIPEAHQQVAAIIKNLPDDADQDEFVSWVKACFRARKKLANLKKHATRDCRLETTWQTGTCLQ